MTTLTDEEKSKRAERRKQLKAEREALWAQQLADHKKREDEFRATLPARIADIHELAKGLGVRTEVRLTATGPEVLFEYDGTEENVYINDVLTYSSKEDSVAFVDERLKEIRAAREVKNARKVLASNAWNKLTDEEKAAIKEFRFSFL